MLKMERLFIQGKNNAPSILLDADKHLLKISGKSYPEDTERIFTPVIEWLENFKSENPHTNIQCVFDLDFINSISHKRLWQIFAILKNWESPEKNVDIKWYFSAEDEDIMDAGLDLANLSGLKFEMITRKD